MAVETKINRVIDKNYVQVEAGGKNIYPKYFKVPKEKADEFCVEYKKNDKKMNYITNGMFVASALIGSAIAQVLTSKMKNKTVQIALGISGAGIGAIGSIYASMKLLEKKGNEFLKKFDAEQVFQEQRKTVADIINKK